VAINVGHGINAVLLLEAVERIGDHARLAEYLICLARGEDVRHSGAREQQDGADAGRAS